MIDYVRLDDRSEEVGLKDGMMYGEISDMRCLWSGFGLRLLHTSLFTKVGSNTTNYNTTLYEKNKPVD